jgi:hypothetical protein
MRGVPQTNGVQKDRKRYRATVRFNGKTVNLALFLVAWERVAYFETATQWPQVLAALRDKVIHRDERLAGNRLNFPDKPFAGPTLAELEAFQEVFDLEEQIYRRLRLQRARDTWKTPDGQPAHK